MNAGAGKVTTLLVLHRQADGRHRHQQPVYTGGIYAHQTRQFATANRAAAGDQVLQAANAINQALVRL
jgi:hypothetical protein